MEKTMNQVMQDIKEQFGATLDSPNVTPEVLSILLYEMTKQIEIAFA